MVNFILVRPVLRYQGFYEITSSGDVISLHKKNFRKMLHPRLTDGYYTVILSNGKTSRAEHIHRLVAEAFLNNSNSKCCVNHKDGNKLNNELGNLEWATHSENIKHAYDTGLLVPNNRRGLISRSTKRRFASIKDAAKEYSINYNTLKNMMSGYIRNKTDLEYEEAAT